MQRADNIPERSANSVSPRRNPLSSRFVLQGFVFLAAPSQLAFPPLAVVSQLPSQAADVGEALQFLRKVVFVEDGVSAVLHHFQGHGPKDRGEFVDAFGPGERESHGIKDPHNRVSCQLPHPQQHGQDPPLFALGRISATLGTNK